MGANRRQTILLGVLGAVVVLALVWFAFIRDSGGGGGGTNAVSTPSTTRAPSATTTTTTRPGTAQPGTFNVFATKNPFQPLVVATPVTTPTTPTTGGTTGGTTTPTTPPTNGTTGGGSNIPTTSGVTAPSGSTVALLDVFDQNGTRTARVQVGSTVYTVTVGQTFATSYRVVSLSDTCGQFQFGDSPFQLCEGEQVLK